MSAAGRNTGLTAEELDADELDLYAELTDSMYSVDEDYSDDEFDDDEDDELFSDEPGHCPYCFVPAVEMTISIYRCGECGRVFDDEDGESEFDSSARHRTRLDFED